MKDIYAQFRDQAEHITVTPNPATWERVRMRLRVHRNNRKLLTSRLLNIAAAILVLVAVSVSIVLYKQKKYLIEHTAYTTHLSPLDGTSIGSESIYDLQNVRRSWADLGGKLD